MKKFGLLLLIGYCMTISAQQNWWGGAVGLGHLMPFDQNLESFDLSKEDANNQVVPLFLSDDGNYIWSDAPFIFSYENNQLVTNPKLEPIKAGNTLRDAYLAACKAHFQPSGILPDSLFFTRPQYNTWIELMYNQNQADILKYAHNIIDNGYPAGVLMIDDNWQRYYGNFTFKAERFPDAKAMMDELHQLGFKVMVWICPFVSADSPEFRELQHKGYLLKKENGQTAILEWWNGYSACYDLTNPEAAEYFVNVLKKAQEEYGIDGFKLDAGDNHCYDVAGLKPYDQTATTVDHTTSWAKIGLNFPFNEYRACWKMGGEALVQRLGDKDYSWEAVQSLIPDMIMAGLMGYAYACPDMIGGGQFASFLGIDDNNFNQALIVRSAQVHALMPMMQFSVAPWRVLNKENQQIVLNAALLHTQFAPYIMQYARIASKTGEPIVRSMEYMFPHQGFAACKDQFMLGEKYLVAPVVTDELQRSVTLPKGTWRDDMGKKYRGGKTYTIEVPLSRLPYFEKIK